MAAVNNGPAADQPSQMRRERGGGGRGGREIDRARIIGGETALPADDP